MHYNGMSVSTGGAKSQKQHVDSRLPHLASVDLVADAATADGFRAAVQADIAAATARRSGAAPTMPSHPNRSGNPCFMRP